MVEAAGLAGDGVELKIGEEKRCGWEGEGEVL
jgi:hypothetical protein